MGKRMIIWMSVFLVLMILSGFVLFQNYGFYRVYGNSMEPSLRDGDLVMIKYQESKFPQRGEIILFYYGHENRDYVVQTHGELGLVGYQAENKHYMKRVIGLPGDIIEMKQNQIWINGKKLKEPYIQAKIDDFGPIQIPKDRVFVLGDNYDMSLICKCSEQRSW
ncbi:MAG: signal peptidase I [Thermoactinomyces sp.]